MAPKIFENGAFWEANICYFSDCIFTMKRWEKNILKHFFFGFIWFVFMKNFRFIFQTFMIFFGKIFFLQNIYGFTPAQKNRQKMSKRKPITFNFKVREDLL